MATPTFVLGACANHYVTVDSDSDTAPQVFQVENS